MSDNPKFFKVYDTETTGLSPSRDQIIQFFGMTLDQDLNPIDGNELSLNVKLRPDVVPSPYAFAIHGISILDLLKNGITEFEAIGHVRNWFLSQDNTMIAGFNSLTFDDEMVRNSLYRNMLDPYEHEWKNKNGKMDILRLVHLVYALRPEIMNWPINSKGSISLKLGDLCRENGIILDNAHDAKFDVLATVDLMRLIKAKSPKIWDYYLKLTTKDYCKSIAEKMSPIVLVDRYMPRENGHMSIVLPVIYDASGGQRMLAVDLREDPTELMSLPPEEIRRRMFTKSSDLGDEQPITSIRDITMNKQPLIAEMSVLRNRPDIVARSGLDVDLCMTHAQMIKDDPGFRGRLQAALDAEFKPCTHSYDGIYSLGFIGRPEGAERSRVRVSIKDEDSPLKGLPEIVRKNPYDVSRAQVSDSVRAFELTLYSKWSNFSESVIDNNCYTADELGEWSDHLQKTWFNEPSARNALNIDTYRKTLIEVRATLALDDRQESALIELEEYIDANLKMVDSIKAMSTELKEAGISSSHAEDNSTLSKDKIKKDRESKSKREGASNLKFSGSDPSP